MKFTLGFVTGIGVTVGAMAWTLQNADAVVAVLEGLTSKLEETNQKAAAVQ